MQNHEVKIIGKKTTPLYRLATDELVD